MSKIIKLTKGFEAIVDDEDFCSLSQYSWYVIRKSNTFYAVRNAMVDGKRKTVHMHRFIMGLVTIDGIYLDPNKILDHKDRNGLNNAKDNLRVANKSTNSMNRAKVNKTCSSKYKGVSFNGMKWHSYIKLNGKRTNIGWFDTEKEAALAYNEEAKKLHSIFGVLNEVQDE